MRRSKHFFAALAVAVGLGSGCGDITAPVTLALQDPSEITIEVALLGQSYTTNLVGGVETTIVTHLGWSELFGALVGAAIPADVNVDDVLIAGEHIVIGGFLDTGTICLWQNPNVPSVGSAEFNLLLGVATFQMTLNNLMAVTNPVAFNLLGGAPQTFTQEVGPIVTEVSLTDMLAILSGSGGGLTLSQPIDTSIATPLGPFAVTGTLTLTSTDTFPTDPKLDECTAFIASLP